MTYSIEISQEEQLFSFEYAAEINQTSITVIQVYAQLGFIATAKCIKTQKRQEQIRWHHVNCQNCVKVCEFNASTKPNIFQCD